MYTSSPKVEKSQEELQKEELQRQMAQISEFLIAYKQFRILQENARENYEQEEQYKEISGNVLFFEMRLARTFGLRFRKIKEILPQIETNPSAVTYQQIHQWICDFFGITERTAESSATLGELQDELASLRPSEPAKVAIPKKSKIAEIISNFIGNRNIRLKPKESNTFLRLIVSYLKYLMSENQSLQLDTLRTSILPQEYKKLGYDRSYFLDAIKIYVTDNMHKWEKLAKINADLQALDVSDIQADDVIEAVDEAITKRLKELSDDQINNLWELALRTENDDDVIEENSALSLPVVEEVVQQPKALRRGAMAERRKSISSESATSLARLFSAPDPVQFNQIMKKTATLQLFIEVDSEADKEAEDLEKKARSEALIDSLRAGLDITQSSRSPLSGPRTKKPVGKKTKSEKKTAVNAPEASEVDASFSLMKTKLETLKKRLNDESNRTDEEQLTLIRTFSNTCDNYLGEINTILSGGVASEETPLKTMERFVAHVEKCLEEFSAPKITVVETSELDIKTPVNTQSPTEKPSNASKSSGLSAQAKAVMSSSRKKRNEELTDEELKNRMREISNYTVPRPTGKAKARENVARDDSRVSTVMESSLQEASKKDITVLPDLTDMVSDIQSEKPREEVSPKKSKSLLSKVESRIKSVLGIKKAGAIEEDPMKKSNDVDEIEPIYATSELGESPAQSIAFTMPSSFRLTSEEKAISTHLRHVQSAKYPQFENTEHGYLLSSNALYKVLGCETLESMWNILINRLRFLEESTEQDDRQEYEKIKNFLNSGNRSRLQRAVNGDKSPIEYCLEKQQQETVPTRNEVNAFALAAGFKVFFWEKNTKIKGVDAIQLASSVSGDNSEGPYVNPAERCDLFLSESNSMQGIKFEYADTLDDAERLFQADRLDKNGLVPSVGSVLSILEKQNTLAKLSSDEINSRNEERARNTKLLVTQAISLGLVKKSEETHFLYTRNPKPEESYFYKRAWGLLQKYKNLEPKTRQRANELSKFRTLLIQLTHSAGLGDYEQLGVQNPFQMLRDQEEKIKFLESITSGRGNEDGDIEFWNMPESMGDGLRKIEGNQIIASMWVDEVQEVIRQQAHKMADFTQDRRAIIIRIIQEKINSFLLNERHVEPNSVLYFFREQMKGLADRVFEQVLADMATQKVSDLQVEQRRVERQAEQEERQRQLDEQRKQIEAQRLSEAQEAYRKAQESASKKATKQENVQSTLGSGILLGGTSRVVADVPIEKSAKSKKPKALSEKAKQDYRDKCALLKHNLTDYELSLARLQPNSSKHELKKSVLYIYRNADQIFCQSFSSPYKNVQAVLMGKGSGMWDKDKVVREIEKIKPAVSNDMNSKKKQDKRTTQAYAVPSLASAKLLLSKIGMEKIDGYLLIQTRLKVLQEAINSEQNSYSGKQKRLDEIKNYLDYCTHFLAQLTELEQGTFEPEEETESLLSTIELFVENVNRRIEQLGQFEFLAPDFVLPVFLPLPLRKKEEVAQVIPVKSDTMEETQSTVSAGLEKDNNLKQKTSANIDEIRARFKKVQAIPTNFQADLARAWRAKQSKAQESVAELKKRTEVLVRRLTVQTSEVTEAEESIGTLRNSMSALSVSVRERIEEIEARLRKKKEGLETRRKASMLILERVKVLETSFSAVDSVEIEVELSQLDESLTEIEKDREDLDVSGESVQKFVARAISEVESSLNAFKNKKTNFIEQIDAVLTRFYALKNELSFFSEELALRKKALTSSSAMTYFLDEIRKKVSSAFKGVDEPINYFKSIVQDYESLTDEKIEEVKKTLEEARNFLDNPEVVDEIRQMLEDQQEMAVILLNQKKTSEALDSVELEIVLPEFENIDFLEVKTLIVTLRRKISDIESEFVNILTDGYSRLNSEDRMKFSEQLKKNKVELEHKNEEDLNLIREAINRALQKHTLQETVAAEAKERRRMFEEEEATRTFLHVEGEKQGEELAEMVSEEDRMRELIGAEKIEKIERKAQRDVTQKSVADLIAFWERQSGRAQALLRKISEVSFQDEKPSLHEQAEHCSGLINVRIGELQEVLANESLLDEFGTNGDDSDEQLNKHVIPWLDEIEEKLNQTKISDGISSDFEDAEDAFDDVPEIKSIIQFSRELEKKIENETKERNLELGQTLDDEESDSDDEEESSELRAILKTHELERRLAEEIAKNRELKIQAHLATWLEEIKKKQRRIDGLQEIKGRLEEEREVLSSFIVALFVKYPNDEKIKGWQEQLWEVERQLRACEWSLKEALEQLIVRKAWLKDTDRQLMEDCRTLSKEALRQAVHKTLRDGLKVSWGEYFSGNLGAQKVKLELLGNNSIMQTLEESLTQELAQLDSEYLSKLDEDFAELQEAMKRIREQSSEFEPEFEMSDGEISEHENKAFSGSAMAYYNPMYERTINSRLVVAAPRQDEDIQRANNFEKKKEALLGAFLAETNRKKLRSRDAQSDVVVDNIPSSSATDVAVDAALAQQQALHEREMDRLRNEMQAARDIARDEEERRLEAEEQARLVAEEAQRLRDESDRLAAALATSEAARIEADRLSAEESARAAVALAEAQRLAAEQLTRLDAQRRAEQDEAERQAQVSLAQMAEVQRQNDELRAQVAQLERDRLADQQAAIVREGQLNTIIRGLHQSLNRVLGRGPRVASPVSVIAVSDDYDLTETERNDILKQLISMNLEGDFTKNTLLRQTTGRKGVERAKKQRMLLGNSTLEKTFGPAKYDEYRMELLENMSTKLSIDTSSLTYSLKHLCQEASVLFSTMNKTQRFLEETAIILKNAEKVKVHAPTYWLEDHEKKYQKIRKKYDIAASRWRKRYGKVRQTNRDRSQYYNNNDWKIALLKEVETLEVPTKTFADWLDRVNLQALLLENFNIIVRFDGHEDLYEMDKADFLSHNQQAIQAIADQMIENNKKIVLKKDKPIVIFPVERGKVRVSPLMVADTADNPKIVSLVASTEEGVHIVPYNEHRADPALDISIKQVDAQAAFSAVCKRLEKHIIDNGGAFPSKQKKIRVTPRNSRELENIVGALFCLGVTYDAIQYDTHMDDVVRYVEEPQYSVGHEKEMKSNKDHINWNSRTIKQFVNNITKGQTSNPNEKTAGEVRDVNRTNSLSLIVSKRKELKQLSENIKAEIRDRNRVVETIPVHMEKQIHISGLKSGRE